MNATPSLLHQTILVNVFASLRRLKDDDQGYWVPVLGFGLRITDTNVPVPDLLVRPDKMIAARECDDAIVAIEILSPSTAHKDRRLKRLLYANLPSLQQYVIVAQDSINALSYERSDSFQERSIAGLAAELTLPALGVSLPLKEIYRGTGL